ncbi:nucleoside triphosphate pyrophosphohydrolase [Paenibacillus agricola]|uniref:Nucleoside triphosphate pyrophosphohydrolase n=1 Tax=Paenibacillus agricola TaxID=2716264 RepID=A0ABX0JEU4_9BACL|nr:nucleoside triphosphate pyrophosphohydrolase [Paenibacillus agricola]NHN34682.1 nucleoside triphosphate pyrophosphohydrolase [Paenibacillus agricola]
MIVYNKLIRDKIPQIIESKGKKAEVRVMDSDEYTKMLNVKLQEELDEYKEANDESDQIAELADLVEVVYAILDNKGLSIEEFEKVRLAKQAERGGFKDKLLLVKVE